MFWRVPMRIPRIAPSLARAHPSHDAFMTPTMTILDAFPALRARMGTGMRIGGGIVAR